MEILTLRHFERRWHPPLTALTLFYSDRTHMEASDWHPLGTIAFDQTVPLIVPERHPRVPFEFVPADDSGLHASLAEVLLRVGMLEPELSGPTREDLATLPTTRRLAVLTDANALAHGIVHSLCRSFGERISLLGVPGIVRFHRHRNADDLARMSHATPRPANASEPRWLEQRRKALAFRSLAVGMARTQLYAAAMGTAIAELDAPVGVGIEHVTSNDLTAIEDHLILNSMRQYLSTAPHGLDIRIVTSDIEFARSVHLISDHTPILAQVGPLPSAIYSARFDILGRRMFRTSAAALCWELAYQFARIDVRDGAGNQIGRLEQYWAHAAFEDWRDQRLAVTGFADPAAVTAAVSSASIEAAPSREPAVIDAQIPEPVALSTLLRSCAIVANARSTRDALAAALGVQDGTAMAAVANLTAAGLVLVENASLVATGRLQGVISDWKQYNLDGIQRTLEMIAPYHLFMNTLEAALQLPRSGDARPVPLAALGKRRYETYCTWAVACGAAYDVGVDVIYGGRTPPVDELSKSLREELLRHGPPGTPVLVAPVVDACARRTFCAPWRLEQLLEQVFALGLLQLDGHQAAGQGRWRPQHLAPRYGTSTMYKYYLDADFKVGGRPIKTWVLREGGTR